MKPYYEAHGIMIYHGDWRGVTLPERPRLILADPPYGLAFAEYVAIAQARIADAANPLRHMEATP